MGFGCEDNLQEIMCPKSFGGVRFDLGALLEGQIWSFIPIMVYITLYVTFNHVPSGDTLRRDAMSSSNSNWTLLRLISPLQRDSKGNITKICLKGVKDHRKQLMGIKTKVVCLGVQVRFILSFLKEATEGNTWILSGRGFNTVEASKAKL